MIDRIDDIIIGGHRGEYVNFVLSDSGMNQQAADEIANFYGMGDDVEDAICLQMRDDRIEYAYLTHYLENDTQFVFRNVYCFKLTKDAVADLSEILKISFMTSDDFIAIEENDEASFKERVKYIKSVDREISCNFSEDAIIHILAECIFMSQIRRKEPVYIFVPEIYDYNAYCLSFMTYIYRLAPIGVRKKLSFSTNPNGQLADSSMICFIKNRTDVMAYNCEEGAVNNYEDVGDSYLELASQCVKDEGFKDYIYECIDNNNSIPLEKIDYNFYQTHRKQIYSLKQATSVNYETLEYLNSCYQEFLIGENEALFSIGFNQVFSELISKGILNSDSVTDAILATRELGSYSSILSVLEKIKFFLKHIESYGVRLNGEKLIIERTEVILQNANTVSAVELLIDDIKQYGKDLCKYFPKETLAVAYDKLEKKKSLLESEVNTTVLSAYEEPQPKKMTMARDTLNGENAGYGGAGFPNKNAYGNAGAPTGMGNPNGGFDNNGYPRPGNTPQQPNNKKKGINIGKGIFIGILCGLFFISLLLGMIVGFLVGRKYTMSKYNEAEETEISSDIDTEEETEEETSEEIEEETSEEITEEETSEETEASTEDSSENSTENSDESGTEGVSYNTHNNNTIKTALICWDRGKAIVANEIIKDTSEKELIKCLESISQINDSSWDIKYIENVEFETDKANDQKNETLDMFKETEVEESEDKFNDVEYEVSLAELIVTRLLLNDKNNVSVDDYSMVEIYEDSKTMESGDTKKIIYFVVSFGDSKTIYYMDDDIIKSVSNNTEDVSFDEISNSLDNEKLMNISVRDSVIKQAIADLEENN